MLSSDDHDGLVSQAYASAMGDTPWTVTLGRVADLFGSSASLLQVHDPLGRILAVENHGYSREFSDAFFASDAYANDPRVPYFRKVVPGSVYFDHMLYDVEEMDRDRWCRESCAILGVKYQLGAMLRLPDGLTAGLAILSSAQEGHASQAAIAAFRRLAPHFEQACALGTVVEYNTATRTALLDALARKADGVILLGRSGKPTFMNDTASRILNAGDGLSFVDGQFSTRRPPETRKLRSMIESAIVGAPPSGERLGGHILVSRPSGRRPYVLRILPPPPTERFLAGHAIAGVIHLQDLSAVSLPSRESLREVFGLTGREADFAIELIRCASLDRAASNAGMALNTARNHLQSIFRKTGTAGQTELVQLLGRLP
jgi:DNA-binding CsgD family transcriptional regulator